MPTAQPTWVRLRRATPEDAELIAAWRTEPSAGRYQPLRSQTVEEIRELLRERLVQTLDRHFNGRVQWIIESPDGAVGWLILWTVSEEHRTAEIGYTIAEAARGKGYATEAVRLLVALAFDPEGLNFERLQAITAVENLASRRVLERVGFTQEGILKGFLIIHGRRVDHVIYGLLRDEIAHAAVPQSPLAG